MLLQNILTLIRIDNRVFQMKNMFRLYIVSPLLKKNRGDATGGFKN
jgi:hypothetical protein